MQIDGDVESLQQVVEYKHLHATVNGNAKIDHKKYKSKLKVQSDSIQEKII